MISPGAIGALEKLNEILRIDGGELRIDNATSSSLSLTLDLTGSTCPDCVVPKPLMLDILRANLAESDPDITQIEIHDPREDEGYEPSVH